MFYYPHHQRSSYLLHLLFISVFSGLCLDLGSNLYLLFSDHPLNNFESLGRYLVYITQGHPLVESIQQVPAVPHDVLIGWIMHFSVSLAYTVFYISFVEKGLFLKPSLKKSLVYAWSLLFFPLVVVSYAFGEGFFHVNSPNTIQAILFSIYCHSCYGIGLFITTKVLYKSRLEIFKEAKEHHAKVASTEG
ncbi:DUF2938 family protein [Vibrio campbellii]|uniref:DUF2938 family protein n=1 Tax=Vibrio campbellii TaxID=680 RepID=UPI000517E41F|nr:DUF2938 family protein [Vibrio campbellii]